ncbi:hypothetical protein [Streptomyces sp. NPDC048111]|uniref:hypothetical protein n=1 Tax=Streptomyces sp. NPDC048111 TaxID=3365500 RepID=UPI00371BF4DC
MPGAVEAGPDAGADGVATRFDGGGGTARDGLGAGGDGVDRAEGERLGAGLRVRDAVVLSH